MNKEHAFGKIYISDQALSELIRYVALQTYGIIGLAKEDVRTGILLLTRRKSRKKSISIEREDSSIKLDISVIIEYGTNLAEVARNFSERVKYEIEKYTCLKVSDIKVHVREVK